MQRREPSRGNQNVATVSIKEAAAIKGEIVASVQDLEGQNSATEDRAIFYTDDVGVFYVIQLEPQHDPGRIKVGFTTDVCSATITSPDRVAKK